MAALALERGFDVDITPFEDWDPDGRAFDLICSAQAWHWIEPLRGLDVVARALRPGGRFAAFWYGHRHEPDVARLIRAARGLPSVGSTRPLDPAAPTLQALSMRADQFTAVDTRRSTGASSYTADEWMELEASLGTNRALPESQRAAVFAAVRQALAAIEPITVHLDTTLVRATRRTSAQR
jgi:SAM-dependent methyltransferase